MLQGHVYGMRGAALRSRRRSSSSASASRRRRPHGATYSGGMQRKLDVAVGLMHRPQVLFLDEPTTGLDPEARVDMWHEIARLAGDEGLTILMTTHYLEEADRLAQRLAIVDRGLVVAEGTPDELKGELRGDAIAVELDDQPLDGEVRRALDKVPDLYDVAVEARALRARADGGARAVPPCSPRWSRGRQGRLGDRVPALARRRVPAYAGRAFTEADEEAKKR